jgi:hypothetical protein
MSDIISSDPVEQARYEIYAKGFNAGVEEERNRIIEMLEEAKNSEPVGLVGLQLAITLINKKEQ